MNFQSQIRDENTQNRKSLGSINKENTAIAHTSDKHDLLHIPGGGQYTTMSTKDTVQSGQSHSKILM